MSMTSGGALSSSKVRKPPSSATGTWARRGASGAMERGPYQLHRAAAPWSPCAEGQPIEAEIYCRFRRLRLLNPFVACRDQPDERPQEPRGITRWDQKNKDGISGRRIRLRTKSCDRRVRPHPPPRRSGGPP